MQNGHPGSLHVITVITLLYRSKHLHDAIRSVLSPDYPKLQYIITNDGSEGFDAEAIRSFVQENRRETLSEFL